VPFPLWLTELCQAATKIQASFRGHMSRKEQATALVKSAENAVEDLEDKPNRMFTSATDNVVLTKLTACVTVGNFAIDPYAATIAEHRYMPVQQGIHL
ncbi:unnamed protein product, partial [Heterotrigona itama]